MTLPPPSPPASPRRAPRFEVRISTVLLAVAIGCLLLFLPIHWFNERHFDSRSDTFLVLLLFGVFPITSFGGTVAAFVLLLKQRRWQHLAELLIGIALLVLLTSFESP